MALDHLRDWPGKQILGKQIRPNFLRSTSLQVILQNLANKSGDAQTNRLYFLYITSEVKQYHEALFLSYRPRTDHNFSNTNCTHSTFRSIEARVGFYRKR